MRPKVTTSVGDISEIGPEFAKLIDLRKEFSYTHTSGGGKTGSLLSGLVSV